MKIYEYLQKNDLYTYNRICSNLGFRQDKQKTDKRVRKKKLSTQSGNSIENLMSHSFYKRHRGALKQIKW